MSIIVYIGGAVAALWILFRVVWFLRRRLQRRQERRSPGVVCPVCGSRRLDDYSDRESGMCLACKHVWGVEVPRSKG
jgi:hypothetical protein